MKNSNVGEYLNIKKETLQDKLLLIWKQVLKTDEIAFDDSFVSLGGNSLKALELEWRISNELYIDIAVEPIFTDITIRKLVDIAIDAFESEEVTVGNETTHVSIEPVGKQGYYEASSAQKRMYALNQFEKRSKNYNMPMIVAMEGDLDADRFRKAFEVLVERHESLRTSFELIKDEVVQRVHECVKLDISYDIVEESEVEDIVRQFIRPFDLSAAPLMRVGLLRLSKNKYILLFDIHHIISDGISNGVLWNEFARLYKGDELPEQRLQYKDFAAWQNTFLKSGGIKKQEEYWINVFSGEVPKLNMPTDYPRPSIQSFEGDYIKFNIDKELNNRIKVLMSETGASLYMVLLAMFNVLLSKYADQEDIVVGTPIAGRRLEELQDILGMFVNTLAMRNYPEGNKTFREFLREVKENSLKGYENQDYQFEELVDRLKMQRDMSRNPLFDVMFVLQNMEKSGIDISGLEFKGYNTENKISKFDMTLFAMEKEDGISLGIEYCTKLFKRETIERMAEHLRNILEVTAEDINIKLSKIEMLTEKEKNKLLYEFNDTYADYPRDKTIHQLFEEQVERTPDNVAVVFEDKTLTYRELNRRANRLARLLRKKGVKPDSIIGMLVDRSLEMIVGIIGILKAGGAYLPIDPEYPQDRIEYTLEDSKARILLTKDCLVQKTVFDGEIIDLKNESGLQEENLEIVNTPQDLAYIIYTSGTTGNPKGVMIEHRNVVRLLFNDKMQFDFNEKDIWTMFHSYCFDFSVWEMYGALLYGGKLVLISKNKAIDTEEYLRILKREKVTVFNQIPTPFYDLMNKELSCTSKDLNLRYVIFGGEALKPEMLKEWIKKYPETKLVNMYGITETTVHVTYKKIGQEEISQKISNIGKPIPTLTTYIMDKNLKLLPVGVPGELCVGGDGVGRGYLNRRELTEQKFVPNPYNPGEIIYRSGDLARMLTNGDIEYLGRIDRQVKIRGFRIELEEIESKLLANEDVREAIVIAKEDDIGSKYLCAYIVVERNMTISELREYLSKNLPEYMIPSYFVQLEKMPLTFNGKIDRKLLPEPDGSIARGNEYVAPRNEIEEKLVSIWNKVLNIQQIGMNDSFFELGGHSLKAVRAVSLIQKEFGIKISLRDMYAFPNVSSLTKVIKSSRNYISIYNEIVPLPKQEYYELSYAQKRLWVLNQLEPDSPAYNMSGCFTLLEKVDDNVIQNVFGTLIKRHEAFRTRFKDKDGVVVQIIDENANFNIDKEDLSMISKEVKNKKRKRIYEEVATKLFNLEEGPLIYVKLVKLDEKEYDLIYCMHHIISDGWSLEVLKKEFFLLYKAYKQGNEYDLGTLKIQYKDFVPWQNKLIENEEMAQPAKAFWYKQLIGEVPVLKLPVDYPASSLSNKESSGYRIVLTENKKNELKELAQEYGTSLFVVMLTTFKFFLSDLTKQRDILIGTATFGREHADLQNVIGYFINTTILRNEVNMEESFVDLLKRINENTLCALEYQSYPLELIVEEFKIKYPKISAFFNMLNMGESTREYIDDFNYYHVDKVQDIKFELVWYVIEYANGIEIMCNYLLGLFEPLTIEYMIQRYMLLLDKVLTDPNKLLKEHVADKKKRKL